MILSTGLLVIPFLLVFARPAFSRRPTGAGTILPPNSSLEHPGDAGVRVPTNIKAFMPAEGMPQGGPPFPGFFFETSTSVACPYGPSSLGELGTVYGNRGKADIFHDITLGACGPYAGFLAAPGWDVCTGVGSPNGKDGK